MENTPRLYTDQSLRAGFTVQLNENQAHYLVGVLRLQPGAVVSVFNGCDGEWLSRLDRVGGKRVCLDVQERVCQQVDTIDLTLFFAPVTKNRTDFIVEKACELGVRTICPVITAHTQTRVVRVNRLQTVALEAAEQTGRMDVPDIHPPMSLPEVLKDWKPTKPLYHCDEKGEARLMQDAMYETDMGTAGILVGPAGGFSSLERVLLRSCSFVRPVTLGPRILRAETAVVSALAVWQSHAGDWKGSPPRIWTGSDPVAGRHDDDDTLESD